MNHPHQIKIPATYMRGGTSKGVFFCCKTCPNPPSNPAPRVTACCCALLGSPDPYGKQIDGLGNASSSTSKPSSWPAARGPPRCGLLVCQVSIDKPLVDWSGNCGNLSAAVGPVPSTWGPDRRGAHSGRAARPPSRIWQANIGKTIVAHVPITDGQVQETGDFDLDGVAFAAAEVALEFINPAAEREGGAMFPTGRVVDTRCPGGEASPPHSSTRHPHRLLNAAGPGLHRHRTAGRHQRQPQPCPAGVHPRPRRPEDGPDSETWPRPAPASTRPK